MREREAEDRERAALSFCGLVHGEARPICVDGSLDAFQTSDRDDVEEKRYVAI